MIIKLPHIQSINVFNLPNNFEDLVRESFREFTKGTNPDYQFEDKLLYLDNLRKRYMSDRVIEPENEVKRLIGEMTIGKLEYEDEMPDKDDIFSLEFMAQCYNEGFLPFWKPYSQSSSDDKIIKQTIVKIIEVIITYQEQKHTH